MQSKAYDNRAKHSYLVESSAGKSSWGRTSNPQKNCPAEPEAPHDPITAQGPDIGWLFPQLTLGHQVLI